MRRHAGRNAASEALSASEQAILEIFIAAPDR
jgi:hypothetical protein